MQDSGQSLDALETMFTELGDEPIDRYLSAFTTSQDLGSEIV